MKTSMNAWYRWYQFFVVWNIVSLSLGCGGGASSIDPPVLHPPHAAFTITPDAGDTGTVFHVDASVSADDEDPPDTLLIRWDWEDDGIFDAGYTTVRTAEHRYLDAGQYTIMLEVQDSDGMTAIATHVIQVDEQDSSIVVTVE